MTYGLADVVQQRRLIESSEAEDTFKRVATAKLDALLGLCETASCRRVRLLAYFGEASQPCGNCDTCLAPPATFDATEPARQALSAIYRTGQRFGAMHVIDVLRGKVGERVAKWGHDQLSVFGIGAGLDDASWRSVFRQLVALGLVEVDHTTYGALRLAPAARPVLKGEERVQMRHLDTTATRPRRERGRTNAAVHAADRDLLDRLKAWRLAEARTQGVPAFVILHDATLAELAQRRPRALAEVAGVPGIGARKLERYGDALLAVIAA